MVVGWLAGPVSWVLILIFTVRFVRGVLNVDPCALPFLPRYSTLRLNSTRIHKTDGSD